jgi:hypothetical protein
MSSTVNHCTCANAFQDKLYGPGQRVHNKTAKGRRCTVCGTETAVAGQVADKSTKPKK